ncbi:hypothetical protein LTR56_014812 [Elasticomyces elasticus]|nr:hypothetical protein LTR56_014812 [Elasticomyces elasticus]KAK3644728.1 hypothetical protein LTR22_015103 [Elasticomyces elasticus]KAK4916113.1 hypothetical protein LTR49_015887 [Elasticomyces elasticus]KAK5755147.1 hypothetical protein LTS12_014711 [Elasticomyces elasticus]
MTDEMMPNPDIRELIEKNTQLKVIDERMQAMFQKFRKDQEPLIASESDDPELMEGTQKQIENCFAELHKITDFVGARRGEPLPPWIEAKKALDIVGMSEIDNKELKKLQESDDARHEDHKRELLGK